NWLPCNGLKVPVPDEPSFSEGDVSVYVSAFDDLVFKFKDGQTHCRRLMGGWEKDGFVYGKSQETNAELLLFKVSGSDAEKYIDVYENKILFRVSGDNESLIVSEESREEPGDKIDVLRQWSGDDSKIMQRYYYRIMTKEKWEEVWREHSEEPIPDVDFEKTMIIALFSGQSTNVSGIGVVDAREIDEVLHFRSRALCFQTGRYGVLTVPFGIFVLPKNNNPVKLERDVQGLIGGPPIWKEQGILESGDTVIEGLRRKILTEEEHRKRSDEEWDAIEKSMGSF
ncbi:hypothetical protein ACFL38_04450, partial [Candidatus Omnitrophota bacterium]